MLYFSHIVPKFSLFDLPSQSYHVYVLLVLRSDPLNVQAGNCMRSDRARFERNIRTSLRGGNVDNVSYQRNRGSGNWN